MRLANALIELKRLGGHGDAIFQKDGVATLRIRAKFEPLPDESELAFADRMEALVQPGDELRLTMTGYRPHVILIRELALA